MRMLDEYIEVVDRSITNLMLDDSAFMPTETIAQESVLVLREPWGQIQNAPLTYRPPAAKTPGK